MTPVLGHVGGGTFEPLQLAAVTVAAAAYSFRCISLAGQGRPVPTWRIVCFGSAMLLIAAALVSPLAQRALRGASRPGLARMARLGDAEGSPMCHAPTARVDGTAEGPRSEWVPRRCHPPSAVRSWHGWETFADGHPWEQYRPVTFTAS